MIASLESVAAPPPHERRGRERIPSRPYAVYVPYFVLFGSLPTTLLDRMLNVHVFAASSRYGVWPAYVAGSVCMFCGSSTARGTRGTRGTRRLRAAPGFCRLVAVARPLLGRHGYRVRGGDHLSAQAVGSSEH